MYLYIPKKSSTFVAETEKLKPLKLLKLIIV